MGFLGQKAHTFCFSSFPKFRCSTGLKCWDVIYIHVYHVYIHICVCIYVCIYIYVYRYRDKYTYMCKDIVEMYIYINTYVHIFLDIYVYNNQEFAMRTCGAHRQVQKPEFACLVDRNSQGWTQALLPQVSICNPKLGPYYTRCTKQRPIRQTSESSVTGQKRRRYFKPTTKPIIKLQRLPSRLTRASSLSVMS